jgi:hypothetical protein
MDAPPALVPASLPTDPATDGTYHVPVAEMQKLRVELSAVRSYLEVQLARCKGQ